MRETLVDSGMAWGEDVIDAIMADRGTVIVPLRSLRGWGELDEALNAAMQIGDDTLQRRSGQVPHPESFTHGTSAQRAGWFKRGFDSGEMQSCDTFAAERL